MIDGGLIAFLGGGLSLTLVASFGFAALIAASRLFLHLRFSAEAAIGGGVFGTTLLAAGLPRISVAEAAPRHLVTLPIVAVSLALALHGVHWRLEPAIRHMSHHYWPFPARQASAQRIPAA